MKKYILAICCMAFAGQAFAQPATYFVHKKDGTIIELPVGTKVLDFSGSAVVNDDEYISIDNIATLPLESRVLPQIDISVRLGHLGAYNIKPEKIEQIGINYSKEDEPYVIHSHTTTNIEHNVFKVEDLEFNTNYKCRAFITYRGKKYYSREHSFFIDKPTMAWYQPDIPESFQTAGFYVSPTEAAWEELYARNTSYATSEKLTDARARVFKSVWEEYLTVEKARELTKEYTPTYVCKDGDIYLLDNIGQDFEEFLARDFETSMYGTKGLLDLDRSTSGPDTIVCDKSLNVPNNTYYKFTGTSASTRPSVTYLIDQPLLAGKEYEVEIVIAPDAPNDTRPLPSLLRIEHQNGDIENNYNVNKTRLETKIELSAETCHTLSYVFTPENFAQNAITIESLVTLSQVNKRTHTKDVRIAIIRVRPVAKE